MRILALTNLYPNPDQPNRATFNRQQFQALACQHELQVIAPIAWTTEFSNLRRGRRLSWGNPIRRRISDGMTIHHPRYLFTPKVFRGSYGRCLLHSVRRCFKSVVTDFRPDVVLGCWAYPDGWAAVHLAREVGLPVAVKVQGSDLLTIDRQPARIRRTAEALAEADAVIAVSAHLRAKAIEMGVPPERVHVVYNGVDAEIFNPGTKASAARSLGLPSPDSLLLFVGNLLPVKGLDTLIKALALLARSGARFHCALVGDGPLRTILQRQVETCGLADHVRFVGSRPLSELPQWYRAADLVVLPSRSEGVPNVLLEAAACGTPYIASRVGGIPEIAHPDSLVSSGDVAGFADRIGSFLKGELRLSTHPTFKPHSWVASASRLAEVLQLTRAHQIHTTGLAS